MPQFEEWLSQAGQHRRLHGRPLVGLCFAQSLDGSLTTQRGRSTALSGPESSRLTHQLRAAHDALLVGVGTVVADDPQLTARLVEGRSPQPVILDSSLRTPVQARLVQRADQPVWIATTPAAEPNRKDALENAGARLLVLPAGADGRVSLAALLAWLAEQGVSSLMVEGGARVITSFLAEGLADWVALTIAPVFMGGLPSVEGALPSSPRLKDVYIQQLGADIQVFGRLH